MKKFISVLLSILISACILSGCGAASDDGEKKLSVVTTIFPEYDWVMQIMGDASDNADVSVLSGSGVDMHSFQPTADDIIKISTCDLFIYVGGESDQWAEDALREAVNKDMTVINLLEALGDGVKEEEIIEGMESEEEDGHGHDEAEYDEHVWLSLRNAATLVDKIKDAIVGLDPENKELYEKNTADYIEKLNALEGEYSAAIETAKTKTILFGDRFPFRYLADDYGLEYYAAFAGCSAESEASFETVAFLANKVDELGLTAVLTIEGSDCKIADTVVATTEKKNARILTMDSMQSVSREEMDAGVTYISVMEKNLSVLKDALN